MSEKIDKRGDRKQSIKKIMDATNRLIKEKGYTMVSIREVASEAGVSVGLIYKYFPGGKVDILFKYLDSDTYIQPYVKDLGKVIELLPKSPIKRQVLQGLFFSIIQLQRKNKAFNKAIGIAMLSDSTLYEQHGDYFNNKTMKNLISGILKQFNYSKGDLGEDSAFLNRILSITYHHYASFEIHEGDEEFDRKLANFLANILLSLVGINDE